MVQRRKDSKYRTENRFDNSMVVLSYESSIVFKNNNEMTRNDNITIKIKEDVIHTNWKSKLLVTKGTLIGNVLAFSGSDQLSVKGEFGNSASVFSIEYGRELKKNDVFKFTIAYSCTNPFPTVNKFFSKETFVASNYIFDSLCEKLTVIFNFPPKTKLSDSQPIKPKLFKNTITFETENLLPDQAFTFYFVYKFPKFTLKTITVAMVCLLMLITFLYGMYLLNFEPSSGKISIIFMIFSCCMVFFAGTFVIYSDSEKNVNYLEIDEIKNRNINVLNRNIDTQQKLDQEFEREPNTNVTIFEDFFKTISNTLGESASAAEKKASLLLLDGTRYSRFGIGFFIFSIFVWQAFAYWQGEFTKALIIGAISCSLLFVFIEFLSAWFLRQYRHFVDTSTYLIKVKSLFDRYYLTYLLSKEHLGPKEDVQAELIKMLGSEIKWPETEIHYRPDANMAKEAMTSVRDLIKVLKSKEDKS